MEGKLFLSKSAESLGRPDMGSQRLGRRNQPLFMNCPLERRQTGQKLRLGTSLRFPKKNQESDFMKASMDHANKHL